MSTCTPGPAVPSRKRKRGPYSYSKCSHCRKDKKKVRSLPRHRCQEKRLQCSSPRSAQQDTVVARGNSRNNGISPTPSRSDLEDPAIQCLYLSNWCRMVSLSASANGLFDPTVVEISRNTLKNTSSSDLKGKALLAYIMLRHIEGDIHTLNGLDVENEFSEPAAQSGPFEALQLKSSLSLWEAGNTFSSICILRDLLDDVCGVGVDPGAVLTLQIIRQYFRLLKHFWDTNRQLWKIHPAQLASQAPGLQRYIQTKWHFDLTTFPSSVVDHILHEEPAYCTSLDDIGDTLLHTLFKSFKRYNFQAVSDDFVTDSLRTVEHLLDRIDANTKNETGHTALHILCQQRNYDPRFISHLQLLIGHAEIDINAQNEKGETALHIFCGEFHGETVYADVLKMFLQRQDIDVGIRNKKGFLAADCIPQSSAAYLFRKRDFLQRLFPSFPSPIVVAAQRESSPSEHGLP